MESDQFTKWVACWGNATSITDRTEATYAKNLSLRYPIPVCFSGSSLRFHFSNLTGTEPVTLNSVFVHKSFPKNQGNTLRVPVTFSGKCTGCIPAGEEIISDAISFPVSAGEEIFVSFYLADFTQMKAGTFISGPLSKGSYAYGNFAGQDEFPLNLRRNTNWFYFLNTVDILTEEKNHALICYGDSITAQSWPDFLAIRARKEGFHDISIIRRAVSGTRILREYDCITYAAYGLKGATRFPIEMKTAGADAVLIQHGINDIIHPVGAEVNPFRPWSDMPTAKDLIKGVEDIYISHTRSLGMKVYSGTLLPFLGWRTYEAFREEIRQEFNAWLRTCDLFDGCADFDTAVHDTKQPEAFRDGFDSGDHLHPSETAYEAMARCVPGEFLQ